MIEAAIKKNFKLFFYLKLLLFTYSGPAVIETQGFSLIVKLFKLIRFVNEQISLRSLKLFFANVKASNEIGKYLSHCLKCVKRLPCKYSS